MKQRDDFVLKKAKDIVKNISGDRSYPAQTLIEILSEDSLQTIYDPDDDALDELHIESPQFVSRVYFEQDKSRHHFYLFEYDSRLKNFFIEFDKETQRRIQM